MYLVIKGRTEAIKNIELGDAQTQWLIGRDSACDVVLDSSQVSRRHGRIFYDGSKYYFEDCGSTLGSYIEGDKVTGREVITPGQVLRIANFTLFLSGDEISDSVGSDVASTSFTQMDASMRTGMMQGKLLHEYKNANLLYTDEMMALKRRIHERILSEMHLVDMNLNINDM
ncbi:MAG: FHA domain-containing protein, partial [Victivallaceae bacterium]